tara:strand:- start:1402 stop:1659 length:258 start_codon:yes stop_codon:yes gene_type:complete
LKDKIKETLLSLGGKKNKDNSIDLLSTGLVIRDKDTRHEYTIEKVSFDDEKKGPCITCYRYYGPSGEKKAYVRLYEDDFDHYEAV